MDEEVLTIVVELPELLSDEGAEVEEVLTIVVELTELLLDDVGEEVEDWPTKSVRRYATQKMGALLVLDETAEPLRMYMFNLLGPPQYSSVLPLQIISHPLTVGTALV